VKMVLVFDTDDDAGMKSSLKIMRQLAADHGLDNIMANPHDPKFAKIEFIKMLRDYQTFASIEEGNGEDQTSLRSLKRFVDEVWTQKKNSGHYKPRWRIARQ
jgi:hypothetical protein